MSHELVLLIRIVGLSKYFFSLLDGGRCGKPSFKTFVLRGLLASGMFRQLLVIRARRRREF